MDRIKEFGLVSGFMVNFDKSVAMYLQRGDVRPSWAADVAIQLSKDISLLYHINISKAITAAERLEGMGQMLSFLWRQIKIDQNDHISQTSQSTVAEEDDDGDDPEEGGSNITRAPRFSEQQNNILVDKIVTNYDVLYGKRAHVTSHQQRNQIWRQISDTVTSCGQVPKSVEYCRKRECKRIVKKKMAASKRHAKGTGGGKPANISMKPWEVRLSEVLDPVLVECAVDKEEPSTYLSEEPTSKRPSKKRSTGRPDSKVDE
ncbi:uncharacterized protein LOC142145102 [Mixophyes fleayi]|uniref:uncharacterized protein LOC142145102 n=1 Tax=Mixophyes fleayi TaxID=3061075 RepID=UPI003F4D7D2D